jgi:hypothetical protein
MTDLLKELNDALEQNYISYIYFDLSFMQSITCKLSLDNELNAKPTIANSDFEFVFCGDINTCKLFFVDIPQNIMNYTHVDSNSETDLITDIFNLGFTNYDIKYNQKKVIDLFKKKGRNATKYCDTLCDNIRFAKPEIIDKYKNVFDGIVKYNIQILSLSGFKAFLNNNNFTLKVDYTMFMNLIDNYYSESTHNDICDLIKEYIIVRVHTMIFAI